MKNQQRVKITYNTKSDLKIRLFGEEFVKNNKNNCKLVIDKVEQNLEEFSEDGYENELEIELIIYGKLINMKGMFNGCNQIKKINGLSNIDTSNITDMSFLFNNCSKLALISGLTKWNTSKVKTMKNMFCKCRSLNNIQGLENWFTSSVTDMSLMFYECSSLTTLSGLSNWNVYNVTNMDCIFYGCNKLKHIPKWKLLPIISKEKMFMKYYPYNKEESDVKKGNENENKNDKNDNAYKNDNINNNDDSEKKVEGKIDYSYLNNPFNGIDEYKIIRNEALKFLPQIEIIFEDKIEITDSKINEMKSELKDLIQNDNFSIIEINKGSLHIIITLQYIYYELIKNKLPEQNIQSLYEGIENEVIILLQRIEENDFLFIGSKRPDFVNELIIDITNENNQKKMQRLFESINGDKKNNKKYNIFENAKNITSNELEKFIDLLSDEAKKQECNQFLKNFDNFYVTENELEKALYDSVFEYKIITIYLLMENSAEYEKNKKLCQNQETKIFFHGTQPKNIPKILNNNFDMGKFQKGIIGKGIYFTDSFDYVTYYARNIKGKDFTKIPKLYESFSFITSEVYYDTTKEIIIFRENIGNYQCNEIKKNGINSAKVNGDTRVLGKDEIQDKSIFIANQFTITHKEQILPLYGISIMRCEYLIVWRDYNFDENNPNNYKKKDFKKMLKFNNEIKQFSSREVDSKVYYAKTSEDALELIKRKKYNKIILITNGNNDAEEYINNARKIIGCNCFVLISAYEPGNHLDWVCNMRNTLISNRKEFHERFIKNSINFNMEGLIDLKNDIEEYISAEYNSEFHFDNFDSELPIYPNFKEEGKFIDLKF